MKESKLSGFKPVFSFTLRLQMKSVKYILITVIMGLLLFGGTMLLVTKLAKPEDEEKKFSATEIYVYDETGLGIPDYSAYAESFEDDLLKFVQFTETKDPKTLAEEHQDDPTSFLLIMQTEEDDEYLLNIVANANGEDDAEYLEECIPMYFKNHVYSVSGLEPEKLMVALMKVNGESIKIGEKEENEMKEIVTIVVVFLNMFAIYFLVLFYGPQISADVSLEKTSKLAEQLMVSVHPYGLVLGKVAAYIVSSIVQFLFWILSIIGGVAAGNAFLSVKYGDANKLGSLLDVLGEMFGDMAFSPAAIVLAVLVMLMGLVFYLSIAGFAGSMVTKPEEAPNVQPLFVFPLIIAFCVLISPIISGEGHISVVYHLVPFTSAMSAGAGILMGDVSLGVGALSLALLAGGFLLIMYAAARVYKALMFYSGNWKNPFKLIGSLIKKKKNAEE